MKYDFRVLEKEGDFKIFPYPENEEYKHDKRGVKRPVKLGRIISAAKNYAKRHGFKIKQEQRDYSIKILRIN